MIDTSNIATRARRSSSAFWIVFRNEGFNHLRDRRSTIGALLFPVLGPAILVAGIRLGIDSERSTTVPVYVFGADHAPDVVAALRNHGLTTALQSGGAQEAEVAVNQETAHVALVIPEDYTFNLREGRTGELKVFLDSSRPKTLGLTRRLEMALGATIQTFGALRLMARGVSPVVAHPVRVESVDLATPEQSAAKLLYVIPMMLMLSAFAGGMNIAIDATAGERERKSLEPLLLTPASRLGIIGGKWLTGTVAALIVTALGTSLFALVPPLLPLEEMGLRMRFDWWDALQTFLWIAPLAGFGVALEMLVASFARTFKEAQTYLSLFLLVPTLPSLFLVYNPLGSTPLTAMVPALAQVTAILDLLKGQPPSLSQLILAWATSIGYTSVVLYALEHLWRRERVVFGR